MSDLLDALGDFVVAVPAAVIIAVVAVSGSTVFMVLFNWLAPRLVVAPMVRVACQETPVDVDVALPAAKPGQ